MTDLIIIVSLLIFILAREYLFNKELQKLVDKVISRDYNEYSNGQAYIEQAKKPKAEKVDYVRI